MWEFDRSASRGMMAPRGLYVFSHENKLGNAPAHKLFNRIHIPQLSKQGIVPRQFTDYENYRDKETEQKGITIDETDWPVGVTLTRLTEG